MTTIKSHADLSQSKTLSKILPLESADMYYKYALPKSDRIIHTPEMGNPIDSLKWYNEGYTFRGKREPITLSEYCIPCWSLAALLGVLPEKYTELIKEGGMYRIIIKDSYMTCLFDNPVDACVSMIEQINKLNLL